MQRVHVALLEYNLLMIGAVMISCVNIDVALNLFHADLHLHRSTLLRFDVAVVLSCEDSLLQFLTLL